MTAEQLIATARKYLFVRETSPNAGPHINEWLAGVHCEPGKSWCAAFVVAMVRETDPTLAFHASPSALSLLEQNPHAAVADPQPGDLVVWRHDPVKHLGHVGIVTSVVKVEGRVVSITAIAGNTSADGRSRNGDRVAEHECSLDQLAGYVRVCGQDQELVA